MDTLLDFVRMIAVTMGLMGNPAISISPGVPVQGSTMQVCYTFDEEQTSVTLDVYFDIINAEGQQKVTVTLTPSNSCATVNVPSNSDGGIVKDRSGSAPPRGFAVTTPDNEPG